VGRVIPKPHAELRHDHRHSRGRAQPGEAIENSGTDLQCGDLTLGLTCHDAFAEQFEATYLGPDKTMLFRLPFAFAQHIDQISSEPRAFNAALQSFRLSVRYVGFAGAVMPSVYLCSSLAAARRFVQQSRENA